MRTGKALLSGAIGSWLFASGAWAQSTPSMLDACAQVAQSYFRDWEARSEMQYSGQRTDGTHAVNGRIYLETRYADFACSFDRRGRTMVEFFADGRQQNAYLPGGGGTGGQATGGGGNTVQVTGIRGNDVLNVRSGPGTNFRVVGALANGDRVRQLDCQTAGSARWCQIEMMTDMRERGWVNARYLSRGVATQLPETPPSAGTGDTSTVRVRFAPGASSAALSGTLAPGESRRYVIGARKLQDLRVSVSSAGPAISYQIFNPDRSFLLEQVPAAQSYRGQLWQSGDHVVEVINRGNRGQSYDVRFSIQ